MSAKRPNGTKNTAAANRYAVATQLSVTAFKENCLPIDGRAIFTDELVNGVRNELMEAMTSMALSEVPETATLSAF